MKNQQALALSEEITAGYILIVSKIADTSLYSAPLKGKLSNGDINKSHS